MLARLDSKLAIFHSANCPRLKCVQANILNASERCRSFDRTWISHVLPASSAGKVCGLASAPLGPIPKPGDTRWLEAVWRCAR